ncbi:MAG: SHOCT domain-containing protein [Acidobacteria bacterium]|nr:SHOCT domain-containing protein [Acidobacteriota bacterium]
MFGGLGMVMGMGWMWIWPVLLVIVALVVIRAVMAPSRPRDGKGRPEDILKERYARGEIDKEEFTARLTELRK